MTAGTRKACVAPPAIAPRRRGASAWLVNFARSQGERLGRAYLDFGTPIPVREWLAELSSEDPSGAHAVEVATRGSTLRRR